jgi:hypothetical protein
MFFLIGFLLIFQNTQVPFKPGNEFDVKIDMQFKKRPSTAGSNVSIDYGETWEQRAQKKTGIPMQFLALKITLLKFSDQEVKVKIINRTGSNIYHKKTTHEPILLNVGFLSDIKDSAASQEFEVLLLSPAKIPTSRIHILIEKDGAYSVNSVSYGKF